MKKKLIAILVMIAVVFTALPVMAGNSYAASKVKKKIKVTATVSGTTVTLKWNKIKSPQKGYAVFRDGKLLKRVGNKTKYKDNVTAGTKHIYQIKRYKKSKKKYKYSKASNKATVSIPASKPKAQTTSTTPSDTTGRKPITVTNWKGDKTTLYKEGTSTYATATGGKPMTRSELAKVNKNINGTWTELDGYTKNSDGTYTSYNAGGEVTYIQKNGIVFVENRKYD